ncbi:GOLPH3/VPS74 family protein [Micromonospora sp. NBC_01796]|uniref:GOLPH3/VPS74 family protein n=1 Tax=Micromonospora sp. NBC_01796 TaxID=2975987 RepID=UPI002DDB5F7A|nr:GPP34 family phosphoprotein [Micromonospora sp. NBC_01796]WSA86524.1 GPP34 family phosphoprotein [Micromonospora sp. NBC_01796]
MDINLAEELLLLAYREDGAPAPDSSWLDYGLAGGVLVELAVAGRVAPVEGRLRVVDPTPTGDPVVDRGLAEIASAPTDGSAREWVDRLRAGLREAVLDRLVGRGLLRRTEERVLWVFPTSRYPSTSTDEPAPELDARRRLGLALAGTSPPDPRTHALWSLVCGTGLIASAFPGHPPEEVKRRLAAFGEPQWADRAVRDALAELEIALAATTTVMIMGGNS